MMKKISITICAILVIANINANASKLIKAKYAGEFMATGVDARSLGMGGSFVAIAEGISAGYWNPAGLSNLMFPQVVGMYAERFAKIVNFNYGAFGIPASTNSTLAFSFLRLGVDDIPITALPNPDLALGDSYVDPNTGATYLNTPYVARTVNDAEWAFYLSYAKKTSELFSWGVNIKAVTKQVGDNSAYGLGFDIGLLYRLFPKMNVGVNFQDITTTLLAWDTGRREAITPTLKTGIAYFWDIPAISSRFIPAMDVDIRFENRQFASQFNLDRISFDSHIGLEYAFKNVIALRVGAPDVGNFTAGAGIRLKHLEVDYAFLDYDELGDTHRISIKLTWQQDQYSRNRFNQ